MALTDLQIKYANEIGLPLDLLLRRLASQPMALDANTNVLLHSFVGLLLAMNHWPERHLEPMDIPDLIRDAANSIKHIREKGRTIEREFATMFEHRSGTFRFVRNTIIGIDAKTHEKGDLIIAVTDFANSLARHSALMVRPQQLYESVYGFFDWAFAINDPKVAVSTSSTRVLFFEKVGDQYEPRDITEVRYVVFGPDLTGIDPSFGFPAG